MPGINHMLYQLGGNRMDNGLLKDAYNLLSKIDRILFITNGNDVQWDIIRGAIQDWLKKADAK